MFHVKHPEEEGSPGKNGKRGRETEPLFHVKQSLGDADGEEDGVVGVLALVLGRDARPLHHLHGSP